MCEDSQVLLAGITRLPHGHEPLLLYNGQVTTLNQSGKIVSILLATHRYQNLDRSQLKALPDQEVRLFLVPS